MDGAERMNAYLPTIIRPVKFNRAHILYDSFTDINGTLIEDHTPERIVGASAWSQSSGHMIIQDNCLTMDTTGNLSAEIDPGVSEFRIDALVHTGITSGLYGWGFQLNLIDVDNYWWLMVLPTEMRIYERTAGSFTLHASQAVSLVQDQDYFTRAVTRGDTIRFRVADDEISYTASPNPHKAATLIALQVRTANTATAFTRFKWVKLFNG